jgi:hypothetical protein
MPDFRRGAEAIAKAQEKKSSGSFRPFTPSLFWKSDKDEKFLLFLNPMTDIPTVDLIGFIPVENKKADGTKYTSYEQVIARTDEAIGEDTDKMVTDWEAQPKETSIAVAVELEATFEEVEGRDGKVRKRPTGFEVATTEYTRRIRDDDGELTDDTEEVEAPVIGFITQSPHNFWNVITSFDAQTAPIEETAVRVTRVGDSTSTTYTVDGFPDQQIDLAGLVDCIEGVSYLTEDERTSLLDLIDSQDDQEAALTIGSFLLDKRLEELCDEERYDELYEGIDKPFKKFGKSGNKKKERQERPSRRSQRRSSRDAAEEANAPDEGPEAEDAPKEEAPKPRQRRTRKPKNEPKADAGADTPADEPAAEPKGRGKQSDPKALNKLAELRERQAKRKVAAAA